MESSEYSPSVGYLSLQIEALIFTSHTPIKLKEIRKCLLELTGMEVPLGDVRAALLQLQEKYQSNDFAFEILQRGGGYQFMTKPSYEKILTFYLESKEKRRLSRSALETLAVIAYKQPVTKSEMERVRGVGCDYAVQKLLEKELISIRGRAALPGRPLLYGTSSKFMQYFGLNSVDELPLPEDLSSEEREQLVREYEKAELGAEDPEA